MSDASRFFKAVACRDLQRVRELLAVTPSLVNARDGEGATSLHYAALNGNQELARFLVEQGADVNARDDRFGATPAGWAIEYLRGLGGFLGIEIEAPPSARRGIGIPRDCPAIQGGGEPPNDRMTSAGVVTAEPFLAELGSTIVADDMNWM